MRMLWVIVMISTQCIAMGDGIAEAIAYAKERTLLLSSMQDPRMFAQQIYKATKNQLNVYDSLDNLYGVQHVTWLKEKKLLFFDSWVMAPCVVRKLPISTSLHNPYALCSGYFFWICEEGVAMIDLITHTQRVLKIPAIPTCLTVAHDTHYVYAHCNDGGVLPIDAALGVVRDTEDHVMSDSKTPKSSTTKRPILPNTVEDISYWDDLSVRDIAFVIAEFKGDLYCVEYNARVFERFASTSTVKQRMLYIAAIYGKKMGQPLDISSEKSPYAAVFESLDAEQQKLVKQLCAPFDTSPYAKASGDTQGERR